MRTLPFLLEIGAEEIPDWMIRPALDHLRKLFEKLLADQGLACTLVSLDATPRRLSLKADGLPVKQTDRTEVVNGPPKSAGDGAAAGFARKLGVEVSALKVTQTPKGEYFSYKRKIKGRKTAEILTEALPDLILKVHFPKTMYWTGKRERFIRPIRWMVALLGSNTVPFELAGVRAGNTTTGHRLLGKKKFRVTIEGYEQQLRDNGVLVSAEARRTKILAGIDELLAASGLRVKSDSALLDTLVYLTEFPTPILGRFDEQYLTLPDEVLVTVMRHHQKYFSVEDASGKLAPHFIAVMNTNADPEGLVRAGNERVLRARFNDARFFWEFDQRKKLADRVEDLAHVTWQAQLGSYLEKTKRVVELVRELGGNEHAQRAALLAKCDLTTEMVKEFTELQGAIGGLYARAQGEPEDAWRAVYDHYKPESMEDAIPATPEGRLVSLADKLDTLRGCFGIGLVPSGSRDPFALRRAAQGIVKILVEGRLSLPLSRLAGDSPGLREFLIDRIQHYFREIRAFRYDEVNAVLAAGCEDLVDVESRLLAIQAVRPTDNFEPLAASFKRIQNILKQAEFSGGAGFSPHLMEAGPEADLHAEFSRLRGVVDSHRSARDYRAALDAIASLRPKVDLFFDKVLVNAPDENLRRNRLTLLHNLLTEFSAIADFSEIVVEATRTPAPPPLNTSALLGEQS